MVYTAFSSQNSSKNSSAFSSQNSSKNSSSLPVNCLYTTIFRPVLCLVFNLVNSPFNRGLYFIQRTFTVRVDRAV
jgi:hypothetical protein